MAATYVPTYRTLPITVPHLGDFTINYITAGSPSNPTLLLLHGFPSSSYQFRDLIPLLSHKYHLLAPDLPCFGLTTSPKDMPSTFDNLAAAIGAWLEKLRVESHAMYIFDYGAPVGLRLALRNPERVKAIVSQNGNAYDIGFGSGFLAPIFRLWESENGSAEREILRTNVLSLETTKYQYHMGVPERDFHLINPVAWHTDYHLNLAGRENQERQLDLFYDYRMNKAMYGQFQEYFRTSQVPLLGIWGKGDLAFLPQGAEAFKEDLPGAEVHLLDTGHFALETKRWEIAELMLAFLDKVKF